MTADVELLPLSEHFAHQSERVQGHVRAYARANVDHATALLQAEVEARRAEVARRIEAFADRAEQLEARAERLAEALRHSRWCRTCAEDGWESCEDGSKNDALLRDQEEGHEQ